jgi:hypothetical protein
MASRKSSGSNRRIEAYSKYSNPSPSSHEELKQQIENIEKKYDRQFKIVFDVIKQLIDEGSEPKKIYPVKSIFSAFVQL